MKNGALYGLSRGYIDFVFFFLVPRKEKKKKGKKSVDGTDVTARCDSQLVPNVTASRVTVKIALALTNGELLVGKSQLVEMMLVI